MFQDFNTLFSVRSMMDAIEQWKTPQTFFQRLFFNEIKEHNTRYIEVDFFDEERRIAPFVHREGTGQTFTKTKHDKFVWEPPYIKPRLNIEPKDIQETLPGESVHSTSSPGQRFAELRNRKLKILDNMISRREELMAVQAAFDKSIEIVDEGGVEIGQQIVFEREAELEFGASVPWATTASAKPLTDIRKARRLVGKWTALNANIALHGSTAADQFIEVTSVLNILDNRRIDMGTIRMQAIAELESMGATWIGQVEGVDHFRYDAWYKDPATGEMVAMIPETKVLVGSSDARNVRHYGAIDTIDAVMGMAKARRWPKFYDAKDQDPEVYGCQIHSAPCPIMHQPNAFSIIETAP